MGTKSTLNAKNLRDQLKRILDYVRKNLRFIETDLSISGDTEIHSTLNVKPGGDSVFAVGESQVVINEPGNDVDFRVESDAATHMLFVDGGNNRVSIGSSVDAPTAVFEVQSPATAGTPAVVIDNDDTDQIALQITAANIDASALVIDGDALTTAHAINISADALTTGSILNLVSDSSDVNVRSLVKIKNDNTSASRVSLLELVNDAATTAASSGEVVITTGANAGTVMNITADSLGTGTVMDVTADGLTTGSILNLVSDSSDTSDRDLALVHNDNTAATGTVLARFKNDANAFNGSAEALVIIESTTEERAPYLMLKQSDDATNRPPVLALRRADTTAEADDMLIGRIQWEAANSNNDITNYAQIDVVVSDVTDGDEGGLIQFEVMAGGTAGSALMSELLTIGGEDVANTVVPAVVVNESGINCDFRVESDGEDEAIFLDASAETLYINKGESAFTTQIHSTNDVAMTVSAAGVIFNEDGHATNDFRVESDNNTHMLFVDAGDDTVATGGIDATNHKDGFAVFNDFNGTTFENTLADGHFGSAEILRYSPGADDTLAAGQLFFLHTDGTWDSTDADAVATGATQMLGIGLGGSAQTVGCLIKGFIRIPSTEILNLPGSGACDGLPLYVSTTAGHLDFTAPSGNDDFVRVVGYAIDDDSSDVLVYFDPDKTHVEITA